MMKTIKKLLIDRLWANLFAKENPDAAHELRKQLAWALFRGNYPLTPEQWALLNVSDEFKESHGYHADGTPNL